MDIVVPTGDAHEASITSVQASLGNTQPREYWSEQLSLFPLPHIPKKELYIRGNAAYIPARSPFRYPGGKTWLVPYIRRWLTDSNSRPAEFVEPFAGGGIVGLTVAFEHLAGHVTMVELDEQVAAVWQVILSQDATILATRVKEFEMTTENVERVLSDEPTDLVDKAFRTILKNRINYRGILSRTGGRLKRGENDRGIRSRWYPETLESRILAIANIGDLINFVHDDGLEILRHHSACSDAAYFIDPPYTAPGFKPGARLYTYSDLDHTALFSIAKTLKGSFVMTYNDSREVRDLAIQYGFDIEVVHMHDVKHNVRNELLVSRDLSWLRESPNEDANKPG